MCGIAAAYDVPEASYVVSLMMKRLQHRGRSGAGIVSSDGEKLREKRGLGLVDQVFDRVDLPSVLPGRSALGHVRYATTGDHALLANVQPLCVSTRLGQIAIGHNGNLTNYPALRERLEAEGTIFAASSDTETFLHLATRVRKTFDRDLRVAGPMLEAFRQVEGAYALAILTPDELMAARDPRGFRPLVYAPYGEGWIVASETCALDLYRTGPVRQVAEGQLLRFRPRNAFGPSEPIQTTFAEVPTRRRCSFEQIYFSRPDSDVFDVPADRVRKRLGSELAARERPEADVVVPVPDSSNAMALAYSRVVGIPFEFGLIRDHNTGRTFITPGQDARVHGVRMKLSPVPSIVRGQRVILVDDSIVRGTTMKKVVALLREAGATEVHVRIASPRFIHPCYWGIDTPSFSELAAAQADDAKLCRDVDADTLAFLSVADLREALDDAEGNRYCTTCFTGEPPY